MISVNLSCAIQKLIHEAFWFSTILRTLLALFRPVRIFSIFQRVHDNIVARVDTYNMLIREHRELNFKGSDTRAEMEKEFSRVASDSYNIFPEGPLRIQ